MGGVDMRVAIGSLARRKIPKDGMPRRTHCKEVDAADTRSHGPGLSRSGLKAVLLMLLILAACWNDVSAQSSDDPLRFGGWLISDIRAIPASLIQPPSTLFGAGLIGVGLVSYRDAQWAASVQGWHRREAWRVVEEFGDANAMRPAAILVFAGSLFQEDHRFQDAAFTGLESLILANLLTNGLKALSGRARPWQQDGADDWEPFSGDTSFPSGHATTAFALMTPWIMYFDHPLAWAAMGVAAATSLSRVTLRYHWPSDVLAGALIGSSVSIWLSRRHQRAIQDTVAGRAGPSGNLRVDPVMGPAHLGVRLTF